MKDKCLGFGEFRAISWLLPAILPGLFLLLLFPVNVNSQTAFRLKYWQNMLHEVADFSFLPPGLTPEMLASVPYDDRNANNPVTILPFDGTFFAFRDCFFDVNVWKDTAWVNLYPRKLYGYNCSSKQFVINGKIYSMGRYGFYKMHSELIQWSPRDNRWNIVPVINLPDHYSSALLAQKGDTIISLFGTYLNESHSLLREEPNGFMLDLKKREWVSLSVKSKHLGEGPGQTNEAFDLDDFLVFKHIKEAVSGFFMLDKKSLNLYFWNKPNTLGQSPFFFNSGNLLIYQEIKSEIVQVNFDQGREEFEAVGQVLLAGKRKKMLFAGLGVLVAFLLAAIIYIYRKKVSHKYLNGQNGLDPDAIDRLIARFETRSGTILQVDELDIILDISHLPNPDYKRVRRSKLINDINSRFKALHGQELIGRQRSESDKRLMEYLIF